MDNVQLFRVVCIVLSIVIFQYARHSFICSRCDFFSLFCLYFFCSFVDLSILWAIVVALHCHENRTKWCICVIVAASVMRSMHIHGFDSLFWAIVNEIEEQIKGHQIHKKKKKRRTTITRNRANK